MDIIERRFDKQARQPALGKCTTLDMLTYLPELVAESYNQDRRADVAGKSDGNNHRLQARIAIFAFQLYCDTYSSR